jgi:hypothetical protein
MTTREIVFSIEFFIFAIVIIYLIVEVIREVWILPQRKAKAKLIKILKS